MGLLDALRNPSRRKFVVGSVAAGGALAAASALSGCGGNDQGATENDPQVIEDDSSSIDILSEFSDAGAAPQPTATWTLPLGTVLLASEGTWVAALQASETAAVANTLGVLSLASGTVATLLSAPTEGATFSFYDAHCSDDVFAWTEICYNDRSWKLFAQPFADGALSGDRAQLAEGDADWDPPRFTVHGADVIWLEMPSSSGSKAAEDSHCRLWSASGGTQTIWTSKGRFATTPTVSGDILTIAPRVHVDEGRYYGITAIDLSDADHGQVDQLVLPQSIQPFEAVYLNNQFAFSVEAAYQSGGLFGNMGTFIGRDSGPYYYLSREPQECVAGNGGRYLIKSQSSHFLVDTDEQTYAVIYAPDHAIDRGDFSPSVGSVSSFVTFATVRSLDTGLPESVTVRVFSL